MYQTSFKFYDLEPEQLELDFKTPEHLELDVNVNDLSYSFSYNVSFDGKTITNSNMTHYKIS